MTIAVEPPSLLDSLWCAVTDAIDAALYAVVRRVANRERGPSSGPEPSEHPYRPLHVAADPAPKPVPMIFSLPTPLAPVRRELVRGCSDSTLYFLLRERAAAVGLEFLSAQRANLEDCVRVRLYCPRCCAVFVRFLSYRHVAMHHGSPSEAIVDACMSVTEAPCRCRKEPSP